MSNKIKNMDIKSHIRYFFHDLINIKSFDPNEIKIDEKSYKNILIYYIGYVTIKDLKYVKMNSTKSSYLFINEVNRYFKEISKNKYFLLVPTNENKEQIKKNMKNCGV